jgi:tetratricopeptide (TPR) repeat protein
MADMAPGNVAIKMHRAELYIEERRYEEFRDEVGKIVVQLKGEGRARKLLNALEMLYQKSGQLPDLVKPLSEIYVELGEYEKALEVMKVGLSAMPQDRDLRLNCIRANLALGNLLDARKIALAIHEEDPQDLFILEQLAAINQARGDKDELVQCYKEIAQVYHRQGLVNQEENYYRKVQELCPDDAEAMLTLGGLEAVETSPGILESTKVESEDAVEGFFLELGIETESTPKESDSSAALREGLVEAELYLKYGLDEKASQKLVALARLAPENLEVRQKLRDINWRRGDRQGWVREQYLIARMFLSAGKTDDALHVYQAILEVAPDEEDALRSASELQSRGVTSDEKPSTAMAATGLEFANGIREVDQLMLGGDTGEAISILLRLQELYPDETEITSRLARLGWVGTEAPDLAGEEDFSDFKTELGELDFDVSSSIAGFEAVEVSELDDIVREFKSGVAEKLDDSDYTTHYDLGVAYKEMGLLEESLHEFQKAARYTEKAKNAYTSMAMIYRETGQVKEARSALRLALEVPLNGPEDRAAILYEIGVLAEDEGDWAGAVSAFEKAAAISPALRDVAQRVQSAKSQLNG